MKPLLLAILVAIQYPAGSQGALAGRANAQLTERAALESCLEGAVPLGQKVRLAGSQANVYYEWDGQKIMRYLGKMEMTHAGLIPIKIRETRVVWKRNEGIIESSILQDELKRTQLAAVKALMRRTASPRQRLSEELSTFYYRCKDVNDDAVQSFLKRQQAGDRRPPDRNLVPMRTSGAR